MDDLEALVARLSALQKIPSLSSLNDDQLAKMKMDELAYLRNNRFLDQASQDRIAPYEHRAYARENVAQHPMLAPALTVLNPAYQASKVATGGWGSRTKASLDQFVNGVIGTGEGIDIAVKNTGEGLLAGINNLMRKQ